MKWKDIKFFDNKARPFYFRGTSGAFARLIKMYTDRMIRVRPHIDAILEAKTLAEQQEIYEKHLREKFWSRPMRFAMNRDTTLSMVGVPKAQRRQVETQYDGGVVKFVQDAVGGPDAARFDPLDARGDKAGVRSLDRLVEVLGDHEPLARRAVVGSELLAKDWVDNAPFQVVPAHVLQHAHFG